MYYTFLFVAETFYLWKTPLPCEVKLHFHWAPLGRTRAPQKIDEGERTEME